MAVEYTPRRRSTNDPLMPGGDIAMLANQPDKNSPIPLDQVRTVIGSDVASVLRKAVEANKPVRNQHDHMHGFEFGSCLRFT